MLTDESVPVVSRALYDAYGSVITNTIPLPLTDRLYEGCPSNAGSTWCIIAGAATLFSQKL